MPTILCKDYYCDEIHKVMSKDYTIGRSVTLSWILAIMEYHKSGRRSTNETIEEIKAIVEAYQKADNELFCEIH